MRWPSSSSARASRCSAGSWTSPSTRSPSVSASAFAHSSRRIGPPSASAPPDGIACGRRLTELTGTGDSFVTRGSLGNESAPIACDLSALSPDQRAQLREVRSQLRSMVREIRDLPDGYAFLLSAPEGSLVRVTELIELERRCCPFFRFELEVQEEGGAAWLRLTGRAGVKQFIAAELGLEKLGNEGLSTERTSARGDQPEETLGRHWQLADLDTH